MNGPILYGSCSDDAWDEQRVIRQALIHMPDKIAENCQHGICEPMKFLKLQYNTLFNIGLIASSFFSQVNKDVIFLPG
jgi:hypothetical protein